MGVLFLPTSYKEKFQHLRQRMDNIELQKDGAIKTFSGQLFKGSAWYLGLRPEPKEASTKEIDATPIPKSKALSEKRQTLESLRQFAEEKAESIPEKIIRFTGGELEVKGPSKPGVVVHEFEEPAPSLEEARPTVIFVGDPGREGEEDLLGKMITAMKLVSSDYLRLPLPEWEEEDKKDEFIHSFCRQVYGLQPKVIITLGAAATNILLKKRERLSLVHGRFFDSLINFQDGEFKCPMVPIFHPDFLVINPKMKRTAWIDLQQVMEFLGKK